MTDKVLWSQCCLGEIHAKHRYKFKKKSESFLKDLTKNLILKNDVSGKPLKNEGNETWTIAQQEWKQYKNYKIAFIGFKEKTAMCFGSLCGAEEDLRQI